LLQLLEDFFRDDFPLNPTGGLTRPSGFSPFFEKLLDPPRESPVYVYAHTYIHTHTHTHTALSICDRSFDATVARLWNSLSTTRDRRLQKKN